MRVVVVDAGYGGNDFPGEVRVRVETDKGDFVCEILVAEDLHVHDGRIEVELETRDESGERKGLKATAWPQPAT